MDNGGTGFIGQTWSGTPEFVSATFTSGAYTATFNLEDDSLFTTDGSGVITVSEFAYLQGTDSLGGANPTTLQHIGPSASDFQLDASNFFSAMTVQSAWAEDGGVNSGWSVAGPAAAAVPEPSSMVLMGLGSIGFGVYRSRRKRKSTGA